MMYGYRKERIAECLADMRNMDNRAWDGVVTWDEVIRNIKKILETLENPDAEMAEPAQETPMEKATGEYAARDAQERPEPVKRQRTAWFYRSFGTA